jgi:hypothetical protein
MTVDPQELIAAESAYLESQAEALKRRAAELRDLLKDEQDRVVAQLESLSWIPARSGRCDFLRDAPAELVAAVRSSKHGIRGPDHHFTASTTEPTLFRFARRKEGTPR